MTADGPSVVRPEIELAWHRAQIAGLDPGMEVQQTVLSDIDRRSRLTVAAQPVLDRLTQDLIDTRFSVLLADSTSVIVDRRYGQRNVVNALDRVLAVPGSRYTESATGTNSLATAFELRRPISVTGNEHYLEALHEFSCFGAPIIHPATRRLEGVLDVTGHVDDATELLAPFLMRAVADIEQQLLEGSRIAEQRMFHAFQAQAAQRVNPVVVLSDEVLLANRRAIDLLHATDHAALRELAVEAPHRGTRERDFVLDSGAIIRVSYERVSESPGGVIFDFTELNHEPKQVSRSRRRVTAPPTQPGGITLIYGEPGSGRSHVAFELAGPDAQCIDASRESLLGPEQWLSDAREMLESGRPTVIDDADLLSESTSRLLAKVLDESAERTVVLVARDGDASEKAQAALAGRCARRLEIRPLRQRREEFRDLVRAMLHTHGALDRMLTPSALQILEARDWLGNLRELSAVIDAAVRVRSTGDITEADLPEGYRTSPRRRALTMLQQAEHDTIVAVLREESGNKARAAARLGIGRNTLYERIRRLGISP